MVRRRSHLAGAVLFAVSLAVFAAGCGQGGGLSEGAPDVAAPSSQTSPAAVIAEDLLGPDDFEYLGAFRLPDDGERPRAFAYGGEAMTFNPVGDPEGPDDGFPGSLFVVGHNRIPYGEVPDGNQVAEITIPAPVIVDSPDLLGQAEFVQGFSDISYGMFDAYDELPRVGLEYLDTQETGPRLHVAWGQHFHDEERTQTPTHASVSPDFAACGSVAGPWWIGEQSLYSVNDYLFEIPAEWAERYTGGRRLATGRFRDGGWSGMGPSLYAYRPWDDGGEPPTAGTRLSETVLLAYAKANETDAIEQCLDDYQHPDEWGGGAWLTTSRGSSAVMFAGTKGVGERYWYGWINPAGPEHPCVEPASIGEFVACRLADGTPCPDEASLTCGNPASERGWWSSRFEARFILYDPADLARVATGEMEPWEPQPYAHIGVDEHLFANPSGIEAEMLGTGVHRRFRIGDVAFDRANGLVYLLELFAEEARPVVHVWRVR